VTHAGQTVANLVLSATSDDGGLAAFTLQGTQLIVDVSGWFTR